MDNANIPPPTSDEHGELTEYYQQQFAPVWNQYKTYTFISIPLIVFLFIIIFFTRILTNQIGFSSGIYIFIAALGIEVAFGYYFRFRKVRCPNCNSRVLYKISLGTLQELRFWISGKCPECGTQLK